MGWEFDGDEDAFNNYCNSNLPNNYWDYNSPTKHDYYTISFFLNCLISRNIYLNNKDYIDFQKAKSKIPREIFDFFHFSNYYLKYDPILGIEYKYSYQFETKVFISEKPKRNELRRIRKEIANLKIYKEYTYSYDNFESFELDDHFYINDYEYPYEFCEDNFDLNTKKLTFDFSNKLLKLLIYLTICKEDQLDTSNLSINHHYMDIINKFDSTTDLHYECKNKDILDFISRTNKVSKFLHLNDSLIIRYNYKPISYAYSISNDPLIIDINNNSSIHLNYKNSYCQIKICDDDHGKKNLKFEYINNISYSDEKVCFSLNNQNWLKNSFTKNYKAVKLDRTNKAIDYIRNVDIDSIIQAGKTILNLVSEGNYSNMNKLIDFNSLLTEAKQNSKSKFPTNNGVHDEELPF